MFTLCQGKKLDHIQVKKHNPNLTVAVGKWKTKNHDDKLHFTALRYDACQFGAIVWSGGHIFDLPDY